MCRSCNRPPLAVLSYLLLRSIVDIVSESGCLILPGVINVCSVGREASEATDSALRFCFVYCT
jgi:hypothetical protein